MKLLRSRVEKLLHARVEEKRANLKSAYYFDSCVTLRAAPPPPPCCAGWSPSPAIAVADGAAIPDFAGARSGLHAPAHFTVMTRPLRSALTMAPTELPVSSSTAPCWLVSTMACAPRPSAAPTFPAA